MSSERSGIGGGGDLMGVSVWFQSTRLTDHLEKSSYTVWRRYRDFEWLREMLEKHHPTLITPVRQSLLAQLSLIRAHLRAGFVDSL